MFLQYRPRKSMPHRIPLGFTMYPLNYYINPSVLCYKCQLYGYMSRTCRGTVAFKTCSGPHDYKECSTKRKPTCALWWTTPWFDLELSRKEKCVIVS